ncbi:hypothetical protein NKJ59_29625 [Mesorhizobium australicum]|uniref:hypothetical protein n=1 Tax=Mesorhizobium australicum TaxID=536018 RepID=UPI00333D3C2E
MERIKEFVYNVFGQFMLPRRDLLISWAVVSRACKAGAKHPAQLAAAVGDNIEMNGADCRSGHRIRCKAQRSTVCAGNSERLQAKGDCP